MERFFLCKIRGEIMAEEKVIISTTPVPTIETRSEPINSNSQINPQK